MWWIFHIHPFLTLLSASDEESIRDERSQLLVYFAHQLMMVATQGWSVLNDGELGFPPVGTVFFCGIGESPDLMRRLVSFDSGLSLRTHPLAMPLV